MANRWAIDSKFQQHGSPGLLIVNTSLGGRTVRQPTVEGINRNTQGSPEHLLLLLGHCAKSPIAQEEHLTTPPYW